MFKNKLNKDRIEWVTSDYTIEWVTSDYTIEWVTSDNSCNKDSGTRTGGLHSSGSSLTTM